MCTFLNAREHKAQLQISISSFITQTNVPHRIKLNSHETTARGFGKTVPSSGRPLCRVKN